MPRTVFQEAVKACFDLGVAIHKTEFFHLGLTCWGVGPETNLTELIDISNTAVFHLGCMIELPEHEFFNARNVAITKLNKKFRNRLSEMSMAWFYRNVEVAWINRSAGWRPFTANRHPSFKDIPIPKEHRWKTLADAREPIFIVGDSNLCRIHEVPLDKAIQMESFPGANMQDITRLLRGYSGPDPQVIIVSVGINDKNNKSATCHASRLVECLKRFINSKVCVARVQASRQLSLDQQTTVKDINKVFCEASIGTRINIIPLIPESEFKVNSKDRIHWSEGTAKKILTYWLLNVS